MGNFINDSGPNFKAGEIKLDAIPVYQYTKDFKKEVKAGNLKKAELGEIYEALNLLMDRTKPRKIGYIKD